MIIPTRQRIMLQLDFTRMPDLLDEIQQEAGRRGYRPGQYAQQLLRLALEDQKGQDLCRKSPSRET